MKIKEFDDMAKNACDIWIADLAPKLNAVKPGFVNETTTLLLRGAFENGFVEGCIFYHTNVLGLPVKEEGMSEYKSGYQISYEEELAESQRLRKEIFRLTVEQMGHESLVRAMIAEWRTYYSLSGMDVSEHMKTHYRLTANLLLRLLEEDGKKVACEICKGMGGGNNDPCTNCGGEGFL